MHHEQKRTGRVGHVCHIGWCGRNVCGHLCLQPCMGGAVRERSQMCVRVSIPDSESADLPEQEYSGEGVFACKGEAREGEGNRETDT